MGKRSGGIDFFAKQRQAAADAQARTAGRAEEAARRASEIADAQSEAAGLQMPTETLTERMPQATPVEQQPTFSAERLPTERVGPGPAPENLFPAELGQTEVRPSAEGLAEVQQTQMPMVSDQMYPTFTGMATPGQQEALYQEQLEDEIQNKFNLNEEDAGAFGEYVDSGLLKKAKGEALTAEENGAMTITAALNAGSKAFQFTAGQANIFGKQIPLGTVTQSDIDADPMGVLKRSVDEFTYAIKGDDKLNMSIDPTDPNSDIRPEFGRAAVMATILELGNRIQLQSTEVDKELNERRYDGELDRENIGKAIGSRIERLLYPTQQEDPFTGETESFGYNYRMNERERSLLGQIIVQGFADSPMFDWIESSLIQSTSGNQKYTFKTTRSGETKLKEIRKAARTALGMDTKERPVSLVPTQRGRLRGEGAYTQKEITSMVAPNQLTETVADGIDALSKVSHTVSPHKTILFAGMLASAQADMGGIFAKYTKQDSNYYAKKEAELLREYEARGKMEPDFTPQALGNFNTFAQAAAAKAQTIMQDHFDNRMDTLLDGIQRAGSVFYYGYTAINNSSRMMITQTELNYQSDKVARFLVDGAMPAMMIKGSNSKTEQGLMRVLARSIIPGADKMTPEAQVQALMDNFDAYVNMGNELLNFTEANGQLYAQAKQGNMQMPPPLQVSGDLQQLLDEHGKDAFYFAVDGLHELARYARMQDGDKFYSRVKAEADGNSNGAVIQAYQMGVENILKKGGILYESVEDLESDIRDDVFNYILGSPEVQKENDYWLDIFKGIQATPGKVKELMKLPIMTTIYGKDPQFHRDTARKFVQDNPELFTAGKTYDETVTELTKYLEVGLTNGLGNALQHARMAKRIGRAFNLGNEIAQIEGANGYMVQAGGYEFIPEAVTRFDYARTMAMQDPEKGGEQTRFVADFTTYKRKSTAAATAKGVKTQAGMKNTPDIGSKLRNQLAVNGTQNIDATIAQMTVKEAVDKDSTATVMQVYDAFMGDANSFSNLVEIANKNFDKVNQEYNMIQKEKEALDRMKKRVAQVAANKKASGETFNIGLEGEYKSMGDFIARAGSIINRDIPGSYRKGDANYNPAKDNAFKEAKLLNSLAIRSGFRANKVGEIMVPPANANISPDNFLALFNKALEVLNIERDLNKFIFEVNQRRADVAKKAAGKVKYQYS